MARNNSTKQTKLAVLLAAGGAVSIALAAAIPADSSADPALAAKTLATASYTDSRGENPGAADITTAQLASDSIEDVAFAVSIANMPELGEDVVLFIALDLDRNATTGDRDGVDVLFQLSRTGHQLERWNGSRFAPFAHPPVQAAYGGGRLLATLPVGRLDAAATFRFGVVSVRGSGAGSQVDAAPDSGRWQFALRPAPVSARALRLTFTPTTPRAGRRFSVGNGSLLLSNGRRRSAALRCRASVAGKRLAGTGCSWSIPSAGRGKILVVSITGSGGGLSLTRTFRLRIR
jgi:hypothetical protein